jgi:hypothetical protein
MSTQLTLPTQKGFPDKQRPSQENSVFVLMVLAIDHVETISLERGSVTFQGRPSLDLATFKTQPAISFRHALTSSPNCFRMRDLLLNYRGRHQREAYSLRSVWSVSTTVIPNFGPQITCTARTDALVRNRLCLATVDLLRIAVANGQLFLQSQQSHLTACVCDACGAEKCNQVFSSRTFVPFWPSMAAPYLQFKDI